MVIFIKVKLRILLRMVKESILLEMEEFGKVSGKAIDNMDGGFIRISWAMLGKVAGWMALNRKIISFPFLTFIIDITTVFIDITTVFIHITY